jgi:hypothetical protein
MSKLEQTIKGLTLQQAQEWYSTTEKWLYVDYNILTDAGLRANDHTVNAVEEAFNFMLAVEEAKAIKL